MMFKPVVIIGGISQQSELSKSIIDQLLRNNYRVVGIAKNKVGKESLVKRFKNNTDVLFFWGDLNDEAFATELINSVEEQLGTIEAYIHNASKLVLKPFLELTAKDFDDSWQATLKSAVTVTQAVLPLMLKRRKGNLIFTGATASIKGNANSAAFAAAKFGLRALSQSLAREFGPQGIHVVHVIVDGVIVGQRAQEQFKMPANDCIKPDALAALYLQLIQQDKSCWTQEIDLRPAHEIF